MINKIPRIKEHILSDTNSNLVKNAKEKRALCHEL